LEVSQQPTVPPSPDRLEADRIDEARSLGDIVFAFLARYEIAVLLLLLILTAAFAVLRSYHKYMWYDEIFTVIVATQPTMHRFVEAMPPEGNPPLNTLLVRLCVHLFGMHELAVRLPVLVGFLGALVGLFVFVRRECGRVFGLLAVALMLAQPGWTYAYDARPYGLMLAFVMLGLVSWQSATRAADATPPRPRGLALAGMAVAILGTILSHNIGIIVIAVPLLLGEGVRMVRSRRADWPLLATELTPMKLSLHRLSEYITFSRRSLTDIFDPDLAFLLIVLLLVCWTPWWMKRSHTSEMERRSVPAHIIAAAFGALLLLPVTWLAMIWQSGWYFCRYGIVALEGIAILTCFFIAGLKTNRRNLTVFLLLFALIPYAHTFWRDAHNRSPLPPFNPLVYQDTTGRPIVMAERLQFPTNWWYAPPSIKGRMVYLTDEPNAPEGWAKGSYQLLETCMTAERNLFGEPLMDYGDFVTQHDHFLLDVFVADRSLKTTFEKAGYKATLLRKSETDELYDMRRKPWSSIVVNARPAGTAPSRQDR
jgi:hypothetical protein